MRTKSSILGKDKHSRHNESAYIKQINVDNGYRFIDTHVNLFDKLNSLFNSFHDKRSIEIVKMRYGLNDGIPHTLADIGRRFGLSRERVRQIEIRQLKINLNCMVDEMSKPFVLILKESGGLLGEKDISKKLPQYTFLGKYHPAGVTRFVLPFTDNVFEMPDRIWVLKELKDITINNVDDIKDMALHILKCNLTGMKCDQLVSKTAANLEYEVPGNLFIEACLRTCNALMFTDDGWCLLRKWQKSYFGDLVEILREAQQPMHYKKITVEVNKKLKSVKVADYSVHKTLDRTNNIFIRTNLGTYSLVEWAERKMTCHAGS